MRVAFSSDGCNSNATLMQPYKTVSLLSTVAKCKRPPTARSFAFDRRCWRRECPVRSTTPQKYERSRDEFLAGGVHANGRKPVASPCLHQKRRTPVGLLLIRMFSSRVAWDEDGQFRLSVLILFYSSFPAVATGRFPIYRKYMSICCSAVFDHLSLRS